jgi:hypothetical protein
MSRVHNKSGSPADRVKQLPWTAILAGVVAVGKRWRALSEKERSHLIALIRESGVRPDRMSPKQRKELRRLLGKLDLRGMSGDLGRVVRGVRKRGRRRPS